MEENGAGKQSLLSPPKPSTVWVGWGVSMALKIGTYLFTTYKAKTGLLLDIDHLA